MNQDVKNVLIEAENMFSLNAGMSPIMFMRLKENPELVIEFVNLNNEESTRLSCSKYKNMIEDGILEEYIFMSDIQNKINEWVLVVIKANIKEELQCLNNVKYENGKYKFSKWTFYDGSNVKARKNSFNNLFGQVYSKYN